MTYCSNHFSEKRETIARLKDEMRAKNLDVPPDKPADSHFDSNCITPVSLTSNLHYPQHMHSHSQS